MHVRHPLAGERACDDYVDINGDLVPVEDGTFEAPEPWVRGFAERYGTTVDELRATETCAVVKQDGETCGRELPCPYHSDDPDAEEEDE